MKRQILIVDDLVTNRHILRGMLSQDYDVLEAASGKEAYTLLLKQYNRISAVLLDIVMPELDGYEVLRKMRENPFLAQIPVIMITGSDDENARVKALAFGANDFVLKPYNSEILRHCLRNNIAFRESASILNAIQRDKLTNLYSREAFFDKAAAMIRRQQPGYYIMTCFDIDNFKVINDQYGTKKGDQVLRHTADVFRQGFEPFGGLCCRIAADNFAVIYPASFQHTPELAAIRQEAAQVNGLISSLIFSIGRYLVEDRELPISAMYDRAAMAAGTVKGRYDQKIAYYNEAMRQHLVEEQQIVTEMEKALAERQFEVWYQPQYNHSTDAMIGAEALVRWRHPQKGLIPPNAFLPVFERNGFIYQLDKFVWEEVCACLRKWLDAGRAPLAVSVNVSRYDLFQADVVAVLMGLLKKYSLPVELLRLEITESAFAEASGQIIAVATDLIQQGFIVEIDDFGSGYSSLNTLKDVPCQIIKLDLKFLESSSNSQRGGNIVESVVRMAKWLGMSVIAEGVETLAQADFLRSIGCCYMQGYLFSKPVPLAQYEVHCQGTVWEEKLLALDTVANLDHNAFWDPASMDTLIFNSYVGGACIYEYCNGAIEMLRATEKFVQLLGGSALTVQELLRLDLAAYLEGDSLSRLQGDIVASAADGKELIGEYRFRGLPGCPELICLRVTLRVIATVGQRCLVYCTNENITAQRQAEQQAKQAAQQLQSILDNLPCGVVLFQLVGEQLTAVHLNKHYWELVARQPVAVQELSVLASIHPADQEVIAREIAAAIRQDRDAVCDLRIRYGQKGYRPFRVVARILPQEEEKYALYAFYTPISDQALSYQQMLPVLLSAIMRSTTDLTFAKDKELRYLCGSRSFAKMVGLVSENDLIGKTDYDLFEKSLADKFRQDDLALLAEGSPLIDMVESIGSQDGVPHYSSTSKYLLRDGAGAVVGLYGVGRDITEIRGAFDQLKLMTDRLPGGLATYVCTDLDLEPEHTHITYFNDGFCRLLGFTREEYAQRSAADPTGMIFAEDKPLLRQQHRALVQQDKPIDCQYRVHVKGGGYKWISHQAMAADRSGDRVVVNAMLQDVTQQRKLLERLRVTEEENKLAQQLGGYIICRYQVAEGSLILSEKDAAAFHLSQQTLNVPDGPISMGMIAPESVAAYRGFFQSIAQGSPAAMLTFRQRYLGEWRWLEAKSSTIFGDDGQPLKAVISFLDVTERLEKESVYKKRKQSLSEKDPASYTLFRCNLNRDASYDAKKGNLISFDFASAGLRFQDRAEAYADQWVFADDRRSYLAFVNSDAMMASYYRGVRSKSLEYRELLPDGSMRWLRLSVDLVESAKSADVEAYLMYEDINRDKVAALHTKELAECDPLTGLLNRVAFSIGVEQKLRQAKPNVCHALLMIDLDGFKAVNDVFGHSAGDQTLIDFANDLRTVVRRNDLVCRMGGDEFLVFLEDVVGDNDAGIIARRICVLARKAYSMEVQVSASIGVVMLPRDGMDFEALYKKADAALYHVKGSGRDNFTFYQEGMADEHLQPEREPKPAPDGKLYPAEKRRRMLIVDDDAIDKNILQNIFKDEFIIEKAKDGLSALIRLRHYGAAISVVLLDLMMPGLDGFAVLQKMQSSPELQAIPVLIVSGDDTRETCLKAIRSGAADFITKPVDPELLRIRVHSAVSRAENERLRAKNSLLELQKDEMLQYEAALGSVNTAVLTLDWLSGRFVYHSSVSKYLAGRYDNRPFWHILLADLVADTSTVQYMQQFVHRVAENRAQTEGCITVYLRTPEKIPHRFRMAVCKLTDEFQLTCKLVITLTDIQLSHKRTAVK